MNKKGLWIGLGTLGTALISGGIALSVGLSNHPKHLTYQTYASSTSLKWMNGDEIIELKTLW
ncbi:MAG: hypothetical protein LBS95_02675 [Mycoplasmataceae bacterium]|nr:hypothetical protein [Mycoplasmataceae bacterium]